MSYDVRIKKSVAKSLTKLPDSVRNKFVALVLALSKLGPYRNDWPNYSKLGKNEYHCHLDYSHVACWTYEKGTIEIEVYYAGSRENAPY